MNPYRLAVPLALVLSGVTACKSGEPVGEQEPVNVIGKRSATAKTATTGATAAAIARPAKPGDVPAPSDVAAAPADAKLETSGLRTKVLKPGTGKEYPRSFDSVKVHYTGWTTDGNMFDSSIARGTPAEFPVDGVIKGWTEGLQLMVAGESRRYWIPADLAYGETATRPGAPFGPLVFDVELLEIQKGAEPPATPEDLLKPPATATKTKSGLTYRSLVKGKGKVHPKATDKVSVHYSGWSKDGKLFDSSVTRGKPAVFPLNGVIAGWTEGVQLMVQGDKVRFWIPGDLAYGDTAKRPGALAGQLVFDVELLEIQ